jgi:manganese/zinc/iron transport system substrate-binding protein
MGYNIVFKSLLALTLCLIGAGCQPGGDLPSTGTPYIVTTTGMIADAVKAIGGDSVRVDALMGPGVDPHLYKATQGDLSRLTEADIVFYNGLHLEGKMGEVLEKLGRQQTVAAVAEQIPEDRLYQVPEFDNTFDPHIWFDVSLWQLAVQQIEKVMSEKYPDLSGYFQENARVYLDSLASLHDWVRQEIATIPESRRILITAHDAFGYFGKAYNIEVKALQGISTLSEFGLRDVTSLVDFIVENEIKAVFVETSVSPKAIEAVVSGTRNRGFTISIGGNLYSDAMGAEGTPEGTYPGMVRANVKTIVNALK